MSDSFEQAKRHFIEGNAHFESGRYLEAQASFEASLECLPGRPSTLTNLAATRIKLGLAQEALDALDPALAQEPSNIEAWCHRGVALGALARHDEALACFDKASGLDADHPAACYHRGITLHRLHRHAEALAAFERLTTLQPDRAEAWFRHGQTLQALDRPDQALPSYAKALELDATLAQAWSNRGGILKDMKRDDEAARCFERAIELGADAQVNGFFLAALRGGSAPAAAPKAYVESLFDQYADPFDAHLVQVLRYDAPRILVDGLRRLRPAPFRAALDLGCGTGLCAPLLQGAAGRIDGVDLSSRMLDKARALGAYDRLAHADLVEHLAATDRRYDLVISADVVPYFGDLEPLFAGVRRVIDPGGVFCVSAEAGAGAAPFELQPSLRYAHSEPYLRELASRHRFGVLQLARHPIREDQRRPVPGLYLWLSAD
jgi:predicted TPR repeat methyltransferase